MYAIEGMVAWVSSRWHLCGVLEDGKATIPKGWKKAGIRWNHCAAS